MEGFFGDRPWLHLNGNCMLVGIGGRGSFREEVWSDGHTRIEVETSYNIRTCTRSLPPPSHSKLTSNHRRSPASNLSIAQTRTCFEHWQLVLNTHHVPSITIVSEHHWVKLHCISILPSRSYVLSKNTSTHFAELIHKPATVKFIFFIFLSFPSFPVTVPSIADASVSCLPLSGTFSCPNAQPDRSSKPFGWPTWSAIPQPLRQPDRQEEHPPCSCSSKPPAEIAQTTSARVLPV